MLLAAKIFCGLVALFHMYIMYMEVFAWKTLGRKTFGGTKEFFETTKAMAGNQGVYNGFLAAGLIWGLTIQNTEWSINVLIFFTLCVVFAGIYGAFSVSKKIFFFQSIPAIIAFCLLILTK